MIQCSFYLTSICKRQFVKYYRSLLSISTKAMIYSKPEMFLLKEHQKSNSQYRIITHNIDGFYLKGFKVPKDVWY